MVCTDQLNEITIFKSRITNNIQIPMFKIRNNKRKELREHPWYGSRKVNSVMPGDLRDFHDYRPNPKGPSFILDLAIWSLGFGVSASLSVLSGVNNICLAYCQPNRFMGLTIYAYFNRMSLSWGSMVWWLQKTSFRSRIRSGMTDPESSLFKYLWTPAPGSESGTSFAGVTNRSHGILLKLMALSVESAIRL